MPTNEQEKGISDSLEALESDGGGCLAEAWLWVAAAAVAAAITDERARRQSGTTRDQSGQTESSELLTAPQQKEDDGRKKAEQRRPSEIKGARIKGLSAFFFPPVWQGREVGNRGGLQWTLNGSDNCMLRLRRTSLTNSASLSQRHCVTYLQRTLDASLMLHSDSQSTFSTTSFIHLFHAVVQ